MGDWGWSRLRGLEKATILRGFDDATAYGGPFHVEIQPTDRCRFGCFFCSTRPIRREAEIPLDLVADLLAQLKCLGTRAATLNGGGEPLNHTRITELIEILARSGIRLDHLTTNGSRLDANVAEALVRARCRNVIVSLNASDEATYRSMMGVPAAVFPQVLGNIRGLMAARRRHRTASPSVVVQFLVYKETSGKIRDMYQLATSLGVDGISFNGICNLTPDLRMDPLQTGAMMETFEQLLREDEYRRIGGINSFEQNIGQHVARIEERIGQERSRMPRLVRLWKLFRRHDFSLSEKLRHHFLARRRTAARAALRRLDAPCLGPWHTLTIKADGSVPACCVLQDRKVADVRQRPIEEIWNGERFRRMREQVSFLVRHGHSAGFDPARCPDLVPMCNGACPFRNFYYCEDAPFLGLVQERVAAMRHH